MAIVEAKRNDVESALGQCTAQMLGATLLNQQHGTVFEAIYGCVTTGEIWQFLKLVGNEIVIDQDRYYIDRIELVLGVLQAILDEFQ